MSNLLKVHCNLNVSLNVAGHTDKVPERRSTLQRADRTLTAVEIGKVINKAAHISKKKKCRELIPNQSHIRL